MQPPPLSRKDSEHLKLLTIFHYVVAGLALFGIGFLCFHFTIMNALLSNPGMWKNGPNVTPPPPEFFAWLKWIYVILGFLFLVASLLNLLSAHFLQTRRNRTFSLVVAGCNCLQMPFGTILGVFTIIVLSRDSVRALYPV